jgi:hypothetical protein
MQEEDCNSLTQIVCREDKFEKGIFCCVPQTLQRFSSLMLSFYHLKKRESPKPFVLHVSKINFSSFFVFFTKNFFHNKLLGRIDDMIPFAMICLKPGNPAAFK